MKVPKAITLYDHVAFDPLQFIGHVPDFEDSEASTGFWDLSQVVQRLKCWRQRYPEITPVYVLRRNDDPQVLKIAANFGCRFICSSRGETDELLRCNNLPTENIMWSNSVLCLRDCKYAKFAKIGCLQVGRTSSLYDIQAGHPEASICLSVSLDSPELCNGGSQLGFSHTYEELEKSLHVARDLKLRVTGLTIVKNSNWNNVTVEDVFAQAKRVLVLADSLGFQIESLTIPEIIKNPSLESLMENLRMIHEITPNYLADHWPLKLFLETNDSLTTAALTIFMTVQAVRRIKIPGGVEEKVQYFVDDGQHNSFRKVPRTVRHSQVHFIRRNTLQIVESDELFRTEVFGPSCDGNDIVLADFLMPELGIGDLIYLTNVGSDTLAMRTNFNGFQNCNPHYFMQKCDAGATADKQQNVERF